LKDHLEKIQADLGTVETWIMGNTQSSSFLRETFSAVLEIKTQNTYNKETCNEICLCCGHDFEKHKGIITTAARNGLDKDMTELPAMCSDWVDEQGIFVQRSETVLKRVETMDSHYISFDVSCKSDQKKLIKFLQYVEYVADKDDWIMYSAYLLGSTCYHNLKQFAAFSFVSGRGSCTQSTESKV